MATTISYEEKAGKEIAELLGLKKIRSGDDKGRFRTTYGSKTEVGLALTVQRILKENGLIKE